MGYTSTPNSYQKMQELSMIPYPQQLAIAVPEIRFYKDVHGLLALCPFHKTISQLAALSSTPRLAYGSALPVE